MLKHMRATAFLDATCVSSAMHQFSHWLSVWSTEAANWNESTRISWDSCTGSQCYRFCYHGHWLQWYDAGSPVHGFSGEQVFPSQNHRSSRWTAAAKHSSWVWLHSAQRFVDMMYLPRLTYFRQPVQVLCPDSHRWPFWRGASWLLAASSDSNLGEV